MLISVNGRLFISSIFLFLRFGFIPDYLCVIVRVVGFLPVGLGTRVGMEKKLGPITFKYTLVCSNSLVEDPVFDTKNYRRDNYSARREAGYTRRLATRLLKQMTVLEDSHMMTFSALLLITCGDVEENPGPGR